MKEVFEGLLIQTINMKISFHGAARTVTGSKHTIHMDKGKKILLDCGMFQGMGKDTIRLNNEWGFNPSDIDYVIISHAHIDHIGLLPKLVKDGYSGKIWCTPPTADLLTILLEDAARIQEADTAYVSKLHSGQNRPEVLPLYTVSDALAVIPLLVTVPYNQPIRLDNDIELLYTDCGHILGSAAAHLTLQDRNTTKRITFSGDVGRYHDIILRSPDVFPQADVIIMETTYGDRLHEMPTIGTEHLYQQIVHTCIEKKGKLIIPAFSVGRTQELLYMLNQLETEHKLPKVKYYVDSPLSIKATAIIKNHPECFSSRVQKLLRSDTDVFLFSVLEFLRDANDSIRLNNSSEPCVIISASGMAEAGRVKHHIAHAVEDKRNTILITGHCEPLSLGARLQRGTEDVSIFGKRYRLNAEVDSIKSLSAHADYEDLFQWLACQDPRSVRKVILVHGDYNAQAAFRERLLRKGFEDVEIPNLHQVIGLG